MNKRIKVLFYFYLIVTSLYIAFVSDGYEDPSFSTTILSILIEESGYLIIFCYFLFEAIRNWRTNSIRWAFLLYALYPFFGLLFNISDYLFFRYDIGSPFIGSILFGLCMGVVLFSLLFILNDLNKWARMERVIIVIYLLAQIVLLSQPYANVNFAISAIVCLALVLPLKIKPIRMRYAALSLLLSTIVNIYMYYFFEVSPELDEFYYFIIYDIVARVIDHLCLLFLSNEIYKYWQAKPSFIH